MPTSRSAKPSTKPPKATRFIRPLVWIAIAAVLVVAAVGLPASWVTRFLPPVIRAEDFSGTLWHGSAGRFAVGGRNAGAVEWRIHPWPLVALKLSADVHWVKVGFVCDASIDADRHALTARNIQGGGPISDLAELGVAAGWRGAANFKFSEMTLAFDSGSPRLRSAVGDLNVTDLSSPQVADGVNLGGYLLHVANGAITPDADATAELSDTGGPLELQAVIHFSAKDRTGLLSGTVKERPDAPAALRAQLENLTQLHERDARGRIPVELELAF